MINYEYAKYLHEQYNLDHPGIRQRYIDVIRNHIKKNQIKNNKKPKEESESYSLPDPRIRKMLNGRSRQYLVTYNEIDYTLKQLSEVFGIPFSTLEGRLLRNPLIRVEALIDKPSHNTATKKKQCPPPLTARSEQRQKGQKPKT